MLKSYFGASDILPMWVADMDFETPDFIMEAIKKRLEHPVLAYFKKPDSFYDSVVNWCKNRYNWEIEKDWIVPTPGVVPALTFATLALTNLADKIVVQSPVYFPFFNTVTDNGRQLINNPLKVVNNTYSFDFEHLESVIDNRTKMMLLCSPHNPVGRVWTKDELTELSNICLKNNILIVSDEIHADLIMPGYRHIPIASLSDSIAQNSITTIAASKTFNVSGLSTAITIIPNKNIRQRFVQKISDLHLNMGNIFGFVATEAAYNFGANWLDALNPYLHENFILLKSYIEQNIPELSVTNLEATYLVWINCKKLNMNDKELRTFFIEKAKLAVNSGIMFGDGGQGFIRINIGCPKQTLITGLEQLKKAITNL